MADYASCTRLGEMPPIPAHAKIPVSRERSQRPATAPNHSGRARSQSPTGKRDARSPPANQAVWILDDSERKQQQQQSKFLQHHQLARMYIDAQEGSTSSTDVLVLLQKTYDVAKARASELKLFQSTAPAHHKSIIELAGRSYRAISTIVYASLSVAQTHDLEKFVRKASVKLPKTLFDLDEWVTAINLAKESRARENRKLAAEYLLPDLKELHSLVDNLHSNVRGELEDMGNMLAQYSSQFPIILHSQVRRANLLEKELEACKAALASTGKDAPQVIKVEPSTPREDIEDRFAQVIKQYEEKMSKLHDSIVHSNKQAEAHELEVSTLKTELGNKDLKIDHLVQEVEELKMSLQLYETKADDLSKDNTQILMQKEEEILTVRNEAFLNNAKVVELMREIEESKLQFQANIQTLQAEIDAKNVEIDNLTEKSKSLDTKMLLYEEDAKVLRQTIANYEVQLKEMNQSVTASKEAELTLNLKAMNSDAKLAEREEEVSTARSQAAAEKEAFESKLSMMESSYNAKISELMAEMERNKSEYEESIETLKNEVEEKKNQVNNLTNKARGLESKMFAYEREIEELREQITIYDSQIGNFKQAVQQGESKISELNREAELKLNLVTAELDTKLAEKEGEVLSARSEAAERIAQLEATILRNEETHKVKMTELTKELESAQSLLANQQEECERMKMDLQSELEGKAGLTARISELTMELEKSRANVVEIREMNEKERLESIAVIEALTSKVSSLESHSGVKQAALIQELETEKATSSALRSEVEALQKQLADMSTLHEKHLAEAKNDVSPSPSDVNVNIASSALNEQVEKLQEELKERDSAHHITVTELKGEVTKLQEIIASHEAQISDLKQTVQQGEIKIYELTREAETKLNLISLERDTKIAEKEEEILTARNETAEERAAAMAAQELLLQQLAEVKSAYEEKLAQVQAELTLLSHSNSSSTSSMPEILGKNEELTLELENTRSRVSELQLQKEELQVQLSQAQSTLEHRLAAEADSKASLATAQAEINRLEALSVQLTAQINDNKEYAGMVTASLENELKETRSSIVSLEGELTKVKDAHAAAQLKISELIGMNKAQKYESAWISLQCAIRGFLSLKRTQWKRRQREAARAGVLFSQKGTHQGKTGWYVAPNGGIYYFILDGEKWVPTCGPITEDAYSLILRTTRKKDIKSLGSMLTGVGSLVTVNRDLGSFSLFMQNKTGRLYVAMPLDGGKK